ncbi:MAG TPA: hypothetical protein IAD07_10515 [Candidatus Fimivicinus intestinavium]|nr:hypothetical protein [Candidatus Fimivicinus intestinavium]
MQLLLRAFAPILLLAALVIASIILYKRWRPYRNAHFICPHCGSVIAPGRLSVALSPGRTESRFLLCTACGKFGYMIPVWDFK